MGRAHRAVGTVFLLPLAFCLSPPSLCLGSVTFTVPPRVVLKGERAEITFTVSAPADVAVWVEDGAGQVVRRIGAARLGAERVPAPFQPKSLAQKVVWDLCDDRGSRVWGLATGVARDPPADPTTAISAPQTPDPKPQTPFRVHVALGVSAQLVDVLGQDHQDLPNIVGLGVRPKSGELYVLAEGPGDGKHTVHLVALDRDGRYRRTIIPAPSSLSWSQAERLGAIRLGDGAWMPRLFHPTGRSFTPLTGRPTIGNSSAAHPPDQVLAVTPDGVVYRINRVWSRYNVAMHAADGSAPGPTTIGPYLPKRVEAPKLAVSPDGTRLYLTGLCATADPWKTEPGHAVWRMLLDLPGEPTVFAGDPAVKGDGPGALNEPQGVAVDAQGRVYVADQGNGRIVQYDASGRRLAELAVERPVGLAVSAKGDALYVLSRRPNVGRTRLFRLARYAGIETPAPAAALDIGAGLSDRLMMVADTAAPARPVVWLADAGDYGRFRLLRIEDLGDRFADGLEIDTDGGVGNLPSLAVDPETDDLFVRQGWYKWLVFKGGRGPAVPLDTAPDEKGACMTVGADGTRWWLGRHIGKANLGLVRTGRDNKTLLPWADGRTSLPLQADHLNSRGFCVGPDGAIYAVQVGEGFAGTLKGYGPDGAPRGKDGVLIEGLTYVACSPRVDRAGRLYVLDSMRPADQIVPEAFRDNRVLLADRGDVHNAGQDYYPVTYGSIVRFGPTGGRVEPIASASDAGADPALVVPASYAAMQAKYFKAPLTQIAGTGFGRVVACGADLVIPGVSPVSIEATPGPRIYCRCGHAQFDIDGFDRLIVPDVLRFQVRLYDSEGNPLCTFGRYGNADDAPRLIADRPSPTTQRPEPIALAWGELVAASRRFVYIGDNLNRRVLKVKLVYAAEESCAIETRRSER